MSGRVIESRMPDGGDPSLRVEVTGDDEFHCFIVDVGAYRIRLHARTLVDLRDRLDRALAAWLDAIDDDELRATVELNLQVPEQG